MVNSKSTKYILVKRCMQCFEINAMERRRCTQCKYLFTEEAKPQEKQEIYKKLEELQNKKEQESG